MLLWQQNADRLFLNNLAKHRLLPQACLCNAGGQLSCKETLLCDHLTWELLLGPFFTLSPHLDDALWLLPPQALACF